MQVNKIFKITLRFAWITTSCAPLNSRRIKTPLIIKISSETGFRSWTINNTLHDMNKNRWKWKSLLIKVTKMLNSTSFFLFYLIWRKKRCVLKTARQKWKLHYLQFVFNLSLIWFSSSIFCDRNNEILIYSYLVTN